jgi:hypothetical protein
VAAACALPRVFVPAPGFGSSDCRACDAHLLALPLETRCADLEQLLPNAVWWWKSSSGEL